MAACTASRASCTASRTASRTCGLRFGGRRISTPATGAALADEAEDAADDGAEAALRLCGSMRTPCSSIEICTRSLPSADGAGLSFVSSRAGSASPMRQLKGGSDSRMALATISSTDSSAKRFQLMLTSQLA